MEKLTNLDYNPILKELLINYVLRIYEEDAIIDDNHLWQEYLLLKKDGNLESLFEEECLINKFNDGIDRG